MIMFLLPMDAAYGCYFSFQYQLASSSVAWVRKKATQFFNSLGKFSVIKVNYCCEDAWDIFFLHQCMV